MRTLACVIAATTAATSLVVAALEPAVWPIDRAAAVAAALVTVLVVVQVRAVRAARLPGRHRRARTQTAEPIERHEPVWHGFAGDTLTTGEIDVRTSAPTGVAVVPVPTTVPAAVPVRRAIRHVNADPFTALVPEQAATATRAPWQYWSPALDRRLLGLFDENTTTGEIAVRMRRDRDTVDHRLVQLLVDADADFGDEPAASRRHQPMPEAEAAYLRTALDRGEPLRRMARAVGRTQLEVGRFLIEHRRLTVR